MTLRCGQCSKVLCKRLIQNLDTPFHSKRILFCIMCTKELKIKRHLAQQRSYMDSDEKPYVCSFCYKRFARKWTLKLHLRTHTGDRPFLCNYCPKRFTSGSGRNRHHRTHTGEKPYKCVHCAKSFCRKDNLNTHLRSHESKTV